MGDKVKTAVEQVVVPLRFIFQRTSVFFLIAFCLAFVLASRSSNPAVTKVSSAVMDVAAPVIDALSQPVALVRKAKEKVISTFNLFEENALLRQENERLKLMAEQVPMMVAENNHLRELLKVMPEARYEFHSARVMSITSGPYLRSAVIGYQLDDNVQKGQVVIAREGVVGRIGDVGLKTARVLLATDLNSRIPVVTGTSRELAIAAGNNSELIELMHLPENSHVALGEVVYTSGDGEYFPPGLPIGKVEEIAGRVVMVRPFVDWGRLEYVSIVDYR